MTFAESGGKKFTICPHKVIKHLGKDIGKKHAWGLVASLFLFNEGVAKDLYCMKLDISFEFIYRTGKQSDEQNH